MFRHYSPHDITSHQQHQNPPQQHQNLPQQHQNQPQQRQNQPQQFNPQPQVNLQQGHPYPPVNPPLG